MNIVSMGTLNTALVHPREVFKSAILSNACDIILVHNHPSGNCTPSPQDIQITENLRKCGELLGIPVKDHIIIGGGKEYYSFMENGLLGREEKSAGMNIAGEKEMPERGR